MLGPIAFQEQALQRKLWGKQREIVQSIHCNRSTAVKGCHGSGKTFAISGHLPYELLTHDEAIFLTIAPTLRQVKTMWTEIDSAIRSIRANLPEPTTTGWHLSEKCYAMGFSSSKGVNAQGFHGKRVTIFADEAIGISGDVWDALDGIRMAGDVRLITACNPTVPSGPVYDSFGRLKNRPGHHCVTISAFDTPNLAGLTLESLLELPDDQLDYAPFPWLTRRRAVVEMFHKWGPNNPRFQARVLGEFPTQASDAVFQLAWIERAARPVDEEQFAKDLEQYVRNAFIQVGIDVAGPGEDETTACARIGPYIVESQAWSIADPLDQVDAFLGKLKQRFPGMPLVIMGDSVGIGYHFLRGLARRGHDVRMFIAGAEPINKVLFANAKAEAYWRAREGLRIGEIYGLKDEDTKAQLSDVRYEETIGGKIQIERKEDARARGSSSPDRAEALIMAFHKIVPRDQVVYGPEPAQISVI